ncbi:hypothetical protein ACIRQF_00060 [Streptomyces sp. NPDC101191]|uniref:hypothetical protein n=1 Tax=Streptomyces sp. NPDC101191 TaxID=3366126 RepID=UPI00383040E7
MTDYRNVVAQADARIEHARTEQSLAADDRARAIAAEVARRGRGGGAAVAGELGLTEKSVSQAVARARSAGDPHRPLPRDTLDRLFAAEVRDLPPLRLIHWFTIQYIVRGTVVDITWIEQPGTLLACKVEEMDPIHVPDHAQLVTACRSWTRAQALAVVDVCLTGNVDALPVKE